MFARVINYERGALSDRTARRSPPASHDPSTCRRLSSRGGQGDFDTASAEMATMAILSLWDRYRPLVQAGCNLARLAGSRTGSAQMQHYGSWGPDENRVSWRLVLEGVCDQTRPDGQYLGWADRVAAGLRDLSPHANLAVRGKLP